MQNNLSSCLEFLNIGKEIDSVTERLAPMRAECSPLPQHVPGICNAVGCPAVRCKQCNEAAARSHTSLFS